MKQPRRYQVRALHDVQKLSQREIAESLSISAATVNRDLAETVPPASHTDRGVPFYPSGRFDQDNEYIARVTQLKQQMPDHNARLIAAREFAGLPVKHGRIRSEKAKQKLLDDFDQGKREAFG